MSDSTNPYTPVPLSEPASPTAGRQYPLRLWPGVALVAVFWLVQLWASIGEPEMSKFFIGKMIAPEVAMAGLLLWWLFASRLRWSDRYLVVATFVVVTLGTMFFADGSFGDAKSRGMALIVFAAPVMASAWIGWLLISYFVSWPLRRAVLLLIFVAVGAGCCTLRNEGVNGEFVAKFHWRWTPTSEQKLLAELKAKPPRSADLKAAAPSGETEINEQPGDWLGFRGPRRDGRLMGVRINTDWKQSPPKQLWRHAVGPGWSSFCVVGDRLFTQEQRGPDEYVVCYDATTGDEVWAHNDTTRFFDAQSGAGPRATPTFHAGRLYSYGANSHLNCLDAATGKPFWSHDVAEESKSGEAKDIPMWGFASSPLVTHGLVVVFAGARNGKTVAAYKEDKGDLAWTARVGPAPEKPEQEKLQMSYCSPELATVDGVEQILIDTDAGASGFEPATGKELWHHPWTAAMPRIVQPAVIGDGDVLIGSGMGTGTRRISVSHKGDTWETKAHWTNLAFKPYYNDFVVLGDYLYGFESGKLVCVSLTDGSEDWHARGYGSGQVLLLADQALLLVQCEEPGDVALVAARPEKCEELGRFKAFEGKTWNHPVIAHGKLFLRNGEEMACFKLALEEEGAAKKAVASAR